MTDIVLITGANKGLGLTAARRLAERGATVLLAARSPERGKDAAASLDPALDVHPITLDVTDDDSVAEAARRVEAEYGRLDVLVNNAGITGSGPLEVTEIGPDDVREVYETNVFGPVRVTRAFLPLLRRAEHPRVVMVSSGLGSLTLTGDPQRIESSVPGFSYQSSKSALNMIGARYARALPELRVNLVDPGYTATDLNDNSGHQTVEEGTDAIVAAATVAPGGRTGTYTDRDGDLPW